MNIFKSGFFLSLRTIAFGAGYLVTAIVFLLLGSHDFLLKASPWWPVYGLFANLLCFIIISRALKNENDTMTLHRPSQSIKISKYA